MREALRSLTTRGWAFLSAGGAIVFSAVLVGHSTLVRIGVLVGVLPLIAAWWVGRSRHQLTLVRTVSPQVVAAGQPATVRLTITNHGRATSGSLLLEERIPYVLGTRPRFVLEGLGQGWVRHATYQVRSDTRGQFEVGPMTLRVNDPFGLVELGRSFQSTTRLTVTPRITALSAIPLGGAWTGSGDNRPRAFASGSAEDVTVREYRLGDDLRRVHWRSSARTGELMVRREEQPWQSRATVYLDNRLTSHRGQGAASSLEAAVAAAASVAVHLATIGYTVRLVTAAGERRETQWHSHSAQSGAAPLLEALAVVQLAHVPVPDTQWLAEPGQGEVTIGVFGALVEQDVAFLRRLRTHAASSLALAFDADQWATHLPPTPGPGAATLLASAGWSSVVVGPRDRIDSRWQDLGLLQTRSDVLAVRRA